MRGYRVLFVIAMALSLSILAVAKEEEKEIGKKDLPAPVLAAFEKSYSNAKFKECNIETIDEKASYEIKTVDGKVKRDIHYKADGTVTEIDEAMKTDSLPKAITAAIEQAHAGCKIKRAEKVLIGEKVEYSVKIKQNDEMFEVQLDPAGKVLKDEKFEYHHHESNETKDKTTKTAK